MEGNFCCRISEFLEQTWFYLLVYLGWWISAPSPKSYFGCPIRFFWRPIHLWGQDGVQHNKSRYPPISDKRKFRDGPRHILWNRTWLWWGKDFGNDYFSKLLFGTLSNKEMHWHFDQSNGLRWRRWTSLGVCSEVSTWRIENSNYWGLEEYGRLGVKEKTVKDNIFWCIQDHSTQEKQFQHFNPNL